MSVDLLYVSYNRLEYTRQTFAALLEHTDWDEVNRLYVHDDGSTDGTADYIRDTLAVDCPVDYVFHDRRLGGPVAAMNWYLDQHAEWNTAHSEAAPDVFGKIDNDMIVCPGWLGEMTKVLTANPGLDILGMEPFIGVAAPAPAPRTVTGARHIGGKGLIRVRAFHMCKMQANGYQGFTQWQTGHPSVSKAWITPDLPVFGLDQLPFEPWLSLAADYVAKGWHRYWAPYDASAPRYWDWWSPLP